MPKLTADEIIFQSHKRTFVQYGGSRPSRRPLYGGQDAQYIRIEGLSMDEAGSIDPVWMHDPNRVGKFRLVGRTRTAPDLPVATVVFTEKHAALPRHMAQVGCLSLYEPTGRCGDLSDWNGGWGDYVRIYSNGRVAKKSSSDPTAWGDGDEQLEVSLETTFENIYAVAPLAFGEHADPEIELEVADVVYGTVGGCTLCDAPEDYTQRIYAVSKSSGAGSPGLPAQIVYTLNGGGIWLEAIITGIGASVDPSAIEIVGNYLLVLVPAEGAYYYATLSALGAPGAFTKITTGFVANKNPNDVYVAGPHAIWFCGDGGYLYQSTDLTTGVSVINNGSATTNDLWRIDGEDETIVAVGEGSTCLRSINRGATWATTTASPSAIAVSLAAVAVLSKDTFWVGTDVTGRLLYTENGGESWTERPFPGSGSGSISDILFVTPEVGYVAHRDTTPTARLLATWDAGADWALSTDTAQRRLLSMPTFQVLNRIAAPVMADATTAANNVALGGRTAGAGTDGILLLGIASQI